MSLSPLFRACRPGLRWGPIALAAAALFTLGMPSPACAQEGTVQEIRLRKLEAEVRALQRQVFPGPGGTSGPADAGPPPTPQPGTPASTPVTDLLTRMDAVEGQIARLTAQNEEMGNRLRILEGRMSVMNSSAAPAAAASPANAPPPRPTPLITRAGAPTDSLSGTAASSSRSGDIVARANARPSPGRLAAVKAVVKPQTNDPGDDDYTYGYKLWQAMFYPEAEQQLKLFLDKYPRHPRATYARNLLGRAFYDDGHPREAAPWFLQNYQANKHGERAPDSLLYLAQSMVALKDTNRACIALSEFADTYPAEAAGRLKTQLAAARASVTCN